MSVRVDGNSEKISPQPKNTTPDSSTNSTALSRVSSHNAMATPSSAKAKNIVFSRPILSETQPNSGRAEVGGEGGHLRGDHEARRGHHGHHREHQPEDRRLQGLRRAEILNGR